MTERDAPQESAAPVLAPVQLAGFTAGFSDTARLAEGPATAILGSAPVQLDPGLGPIDLGYPILVDLGAGDAPYDDGVAPIHVDAQKRGGFSDSVIRVTWRERITDRASIHGGAAIFRYQDLGILDGLPESRFGFAVVGIRFQL